MGTVRADNFADGAGTGAPDFAQGLKVSGAWDTSGGATLATDTVPGIVSAEKTEVIDVSGSGEFTSGTLRVSRVGNMVTISEVTTLLHPSDSNIDSGVIIPTWARPQSTVGAIYDFGSSRLSSIAVSNTGTFTLRYRNWSGAAFSDVNGPIVSIAYSVP